jgi:hypothetical protein
MFVLNDETIESAIDNISGYIVATAAERLGRPIEEISTKFFLSETYALLADKETGYYWDSLGDTIDKFI